MKRITFDLPEPLYERVRLAAFNERSTVSEVVRSRLAAAFPEPDAEREGADP